MNRILFDLKCTQPAGSTKRHGGGKYGEIVLRRIVERKLPVICCYDSSLWFNEEMKSYLEDNSVELIDLQKTPLDDIVDTYNIKMMYIPCYITEAMSKYSKCKVVTTIHGQRTLEAPIDYYDTLYRPYSNIGRYLIKRLFTHYYRHKRHAEPIRRMLLSEMGIVTVSEHSAAAFKTFFPDFKDRDIPVFYSPNTSVLNIDKRKYNEKYFLLVSAGRPFKNCLRAVKALDKLFSVGYLKDYRVKITGDRGPSTFLYNIANKDKFDFMGYVDEQELDQLYHDAYCLIYPSLNEGFGYPPLEAMHYGTPVLASPLSSIPEVCQGAAIYFNPFSIDEIMNRIILITDEARHKKYSDLAYKQFDIIKKRQDEDLDKLIDYLYAI